MIRFPCGICGAVLTALYDGDGRDAVVGSVPCACHAVYTLVRKTIDEHRGLVVFPAIEPLEGGGLLKEFTGVSCVCGAFVAVPGAIDRPALFYPFGATRLYVVTQRAASCPLCGAELDLGAHHTGDAIAARAPYWLLDADEGIPI